MPKATPKAASAEPAPNPRFVALLLRHPAALLSSVAAFLEELPETGGLLELGLDVQFVADALRARLAESGAGDELARDFVLAVARSGLGAPEHAAIEAAVRGALGGDFLDLMEQPDCVDEVLDGPGRAVWLASPSVFFDPEQLWSGLASRPAAAREAARAWRAFREEGAPEPFLFGSDGLLEPGDVALDEIETELACARIEAFAAAGREEDIVRAAAKTIESASNPPRVAEATRAKRQAARLACARKAVDILRAGADSKGSLCVELLAAVAQLPEGAPEREVLARAAAEIPLGLDGPEGTPDDCRDERLSLWTPSGQGLLTLPPRKVGSAAPFFETPRLTLADYALAFGGRRGACGEADSASGTFSPSLDALASDLRSLGLADAIVASGSPALLLGLVELGVPIQAGGASQRQLAAVGESAAILISTRSIVPAASAKGALRI